MSSVYKTVQKEVYKSTTIGMLALVDQSLNGTLLLDNIDKKIQKHFHDLAEHIAQLTPGEVIRLQEQVSEKVERLCMTPQQSSIEDIVRRDTFHKLITTALDKHSKSTLSLGNIADLLEANTGIIEHKYIESLVTRLASLPIKEDTVRILNLLTSYIQQSHTLGDTRIISSINACKLFRGHPAVGNFIEALLEQFFNSLDFTSPQSTSEDICAVLHGIIPHEQYISSADIDKLFLLLPQSTSRDPLGNVMGEMQLYSLFDMTVPVSLLKSYRHIINNFEVSKKHLSPNGLSVLLRPKIRDLPSVRRVNLCYCFDGFMCNLMVTGQNGKRYNIEVSTPLQKDKRYITSKRDKLLSRKHHVIVLRYSEAECQSVDSLMAKITKDLT